jgi:hypothetical protein
VLQTHLLLTLLAQAPPAPAQPPQPPPPASAADVNEIERALGADAKAATPPPPASAPDTTTTTATGGLNLNPDISAVLDVAGAWFSKKVTRENGEHDPRARGFTLQQLELSFNKTVDPYFRLDTNVVLTEEGAEVEEAYATTLTLPFNLQARAGRFLTRFGRINPTHPHTWDFLDQPFFWTRVFGGDGNRGDGAELSWLAPLPWYVELLASSTGAAGGTTARSFYGDLDQGVASPLDLEYVFALKQFFALHEDLSLMFGLSAAIGPNPTGPDNETQIFGADLYLKYRPTSSASSTIVALTAEAMYRRREVSLKGATDDAPTVDDVLHDQGGYASLLWRFAQRWTIAGRYEYGSPVWNRDGNVQNDYIDPLWEGSRHRASTALTFFPTEFSRLRLQGSADATSAPGTQIWAVMLGLEVVIGAHGAHKF